MSESGRDPDARVRTHTKVVELDSAADLRRPGAMTGGIPDPFHPRPVRVARPRVQPEDKQRCLLGVAVPADAQEL